MHRLPQPAAIDVEESFDGAANEMPGVRVERAVEVEDQVMLGEVELDIAEELRERERPQILRRDRRLGRRRTGRRGDLLRPRLPPPRRVRVLRVDAVLVGLA
ncbi:hypothetical protein ABS642_00745 [Microbacterium sp. A8/3-1]|uniref:Uncharacterized protein n=1 Tax=Microbacterium sp. A8/3-1 TaxID=3160749 RepID=A0AAU7VXV2_9MICO